MSRLSDEWRYYLNYQRYHCSTREMHARTRGAYTENIRFIANKRIYMVTWFFRDVGVNSKDTPWNQKSNMKLPFKGTLQSLKYSLNARAGQFGLPLLPKFTFRVVLIRGPAYRPSSSVVMLSSHCRPATSGSQIEASKRYPFVPGFSLPTNSQKDTSKRGWYRHSYSAGTCHTYPSFI